MSCSLFFGKCHYYNMVITVEKYIDQQLNLATQWGNQKSLPSVHPLQKIAGYWTKVGHFGSTQTSSKMKWDLSKVVQNKASCSKASWTFWKGICVLPLSSPDWASPSLAAKCTNEQVCLWWTTCWQQPAEGPQTGCLHSMEVVLLSWPGIFWIQSYHIMALGPECCTCPVPHLSPQLPQTAGLQMQ